MTRTVITETEASKTNTLVLDREAGELVSPSSVDAPVGAGALLAKAASTFKASDVAVANAAGEKISNHVGATITWDNGATTRIEGNTTVGNDHEGVITQKVGTKSMALLLLMSQNEMTAETITDEIVASLVNGEVGAMARVFGIDFSSEKFAQAEALLKKIEVATIGTKKGRQQASQVSVING